MQRMSRLMGFHTAEQRESGQSQVADQVQSFVAAEFVGKAQRAVHDAVGGEHNGVLQRTAANQSHGAQGLNVALKTKSASTGQKMAEGFRAHQHFDFLLAYQGVSKIDVTANAE